MSDIISSLSANRRAQTTEASNIAAAKALGGSGVAQFTVDNAVKQGGSFVGGAKTVEMNTMWQSGEMMDTGHELDVSTASKSAMLAMKTTSGSLAYTRTARLEVNANGQLYSPTHGGAMIMGRALGSDGVIPNDMSNLDALSTIVVPQQLSAAEATKNIALRMNLAATQTKIHGAGQVAKFIASGGNGGTRTDQVILAGGMGDSSAAMNQGDRLVMTATNGETHTFEFGGITTSRQIKPDLAHNVLGATTPSAPFSTLPAGHVGTITVRVGGPTAAEHTIAYNTAATGIDGQFKSLATLQKALVKLGLNVHENDSRLHIASDYRHAPADITFGHTGAVNFAQELGLHNVSATTPDRTYKFSTMDQLQRAVAAASGLDAKLEGAGVDFFADIASNGLNMHVETAETQISHVASKGNGTVAGMETITVTHAAHGLSTGDYIRVMNDGASLGSNVYRVVVHSNDQFSLHTTANGQAVTRAGAAAALLPFAGANYLPGGGGGALESIKWQKVGGTTQTTLAVTANTLADNGATIDFDLPAGHGIVTNDIIFVSGIGGYHNVAGGGAGLQQQVPDGYYAATVAGQTVTITPVASAAGVADATYLAADNRAITVTKVSGAPVAANNVAGVAVPNMRTTGAVHIANGTKTVRIYSPTAMGMQQNGHFKFQNLAGNGPVDLGNGAGECTVSANNAYEVTAVGNDGNGYYFEFEADGNETGAVVNGHGIEQLGAEYYIDTYSRVASELTLSDKQEDFNATYDPTSALLSLSRRAMDHGAGIKTEVISVVDSEGVQHSLGVTMAKLEENVWAVEVHGMADSRGGFDFVTSKADGQLASGKLIFDTDGKLKTVEGVENIPAIAWNNKSTDSVIKIDWGKFDPNAKDTMNITTQQGKTTEVHTADSDGVVQSRVTKVTVGADGMITVHYANSRTLNVAVLAAAHFKNVNGLAKAGDGMFVTTMESGTPNIGNFGEDNSFGELNSKGLLGSNVEEMEAMLNIQSLTQHLNALSGANAKTMRAEEKAMDRLTQ